MRYVKFIILLMILFNLILTVDSPSDPLTIQGIKMKKANTKISAGVEIEKQRPDMIQMVCKYGDVGPLGDTDGKIDISDVVVALNIAHGAIDYNEVDDTVLINADVAPVERDELGTIIFQEDGLTVTPLPNSVITVEDAATIMLAALGKIEFPQCEGSDDDDRVIIQPRVTVIRNETWRTFINDLFKDLFKDIINIGH